MVISAQHLEFIGQSEPMFVDNTEGWLNRLYNEGVHAPAAEMPGTQWHMPGAIIKQDPWEPKLGPQGVKEGERPYMVVAIAPSFGDYKAGQALASPVGKILEGALKNAGFDLDDVYFTTIMRFPRPINATAYKACWTKPGWDYFMEEFRRVNPRAVLFMGADAVKIGLGKQVKLEMARGQIFDFNGVRATASISHLNFVSNTSGLPALVKQLEFFRKLGIDPDVAAQDGLHYDRDYHILDTPAKIKDAIRREIENPMVTELSVDVETGNDTGIPEHDYVLTFQWSHGPGNGQVIPLYVERPERMVPKLQTRGKNKGQPVLDDDGNQVMIPEYGGSGVSPKSREDKVEHYEYAVKWIKKLFACKKFRWIGHNIREDLKWCRDDFGIDPRPIIMEGRIWCTMLARHILASDDFGLKNLVLQYTDMGGYDAPMHQWVVENSGYDRSTGRDRLFPGKEELRFFHAYRDIAYKYLLVYAMCDVDGTFRLYQVLKKELDKPENASLRLLYYEVELPVQHGIMDVETYGIPADSERLEQLTDIYVDRRDKLVADIQEAAKWPELNPNSSRQLSALIYAGPYKEWEKGKAVMPEGAVELKLTPVLTTGKYPKKWAEVMERGEEEYSAPSTAHDTIVTLMASYDLSEGHRRILDLVRQFASIKNFINLFLKAPEHTKLSGPVYPIYGKGLRSCIDSQGRVRCRISQLSETGRWRHSKPNLAQLPKKKEKAVAELFDEEEFEVPKVRSGFKAEPGWVIMEADWKSAEMFVMGYDSGDPEFIKACQAQDIHGANAVNVFNLDCEPDEVRVKYPDKRDAVKAVGFGIAYGLSVKGLAERLSVELKRLVTRDEAQAILNKFFNTYPKLKEFFEERKKDVERLGYVETMYGRRRYFPGVMRLGREKQAAAQREAMNAPIQGTVADMLNVALINLDRMRYDTEVGRMLEWEVMVGIHDALLVHVRQEHVETMARILKYCMQDAVPLPGTDGVTIPVDIEYGERWGEFEKIQLAA